MSPPTCRDCGDEPATRGPRCAACDGEYTRRTWPRCECGAARYGDFARAQGCREAHRPGCRVGLEELVVSRLATIEQLPLLQHDAEGHLVLKALRELSAELVDQVRLLPAPAVAR